VSILRQYFGTKNYKAETKLEKTAQITFLYKKHARKMLMKLTPYHLGPWPGGLFQTRREL